MRSVRIVLAGCLIVAVVGCGGSPTSKPPESASNKEKIVGVWEYSKGSSQDAMPAGSTFEFTKDGKMKVTVKLGEKAHTVEGTYEVDGDALKSKPPDGGKAESATIKTLTDKVLILEEKKGEKMETIEFKKK